MHEWPRMLRLQTARPCTCHKEEGLTCNKMEIGEVGDGKQIWQWQVQNVDMGCTTWWRLKCRCAKAASVSTRRRRPEGSWYAAAIAGGAAASTACSLSTTSRRRCSMSWESAAPPTACAPVLGRSRAMSCPGAAAPGRPAPALLAASSLPETVESKR